MNDYESFELAAKAVGHRVVRESDDGGGVLLDGVQDVWNPRDDNSDSLTLAAELDLSLSVRASTIGVSQYERGYLCWIQRSGDDVSDYRRAFFRAAVEIGKGKKP